MREPITFSSSCGALQQAAVDPDDLARNIAGGGGREKGYERRHLFRVPGPPECHVPQQLPPVIVRQTSQHIGLDEAWRHGVHEDALPGDLARTVHQTRLIQPAQ